MAMRKTFLHVFCAVRTAMRKTFLKVFSHLFWPQTAVQNKFFTSKRMERVLEGWTEAFRRCFQCGASSKKQIGTFGTTPSKINCNAGSVKQAPENHIFSCKTNNLFVYFVFLFVLQIKRKLKRKRKQQRNGWSNLRRGRFAHPSQVPSLAFLLSFSFYFTFSLN